MLFLRGLGSDFAPITSGVKTSATVRGRPPTNKGGDTWQQEQAQQQLTQEQDALLAQQQAEADRQAQIEADKQRQLLIAQQLLVQQKAEADRQQQLLIAQQQAEAARQAQIEVDKQQQLLIAQQQAETDRQQQLIAQQQAEAAQQQPLPSAESTPQPEPLPWQPEPYYPPAPSGPSQQQQQPLPSSDAPPTNAASMPDLKIPWWSPKTWGAAVSVLTPTQKAVAGMGLVAAILGIAAISMRQRKHVIVDQ